MPLYTIKNIKTKEAWDVECSWNELQEMLKTDNDLTQKLSMPKIVGGVRDPKTPDGFKDHLRRVKQQSGKGNTIRV